MPPNLPVDFLGADSVTKAVSVTPALILTLSKAITYYEGLGDGRLKVYDSRNYKFYEHDKAVARDHAARLRELRETLSR